MNVIDDHVLNEYIFQYLEPMFRFQAVSRVNKHLRSVVYSPANNSVLNLDFTRMYDISGDYSSVLLRAPSVQLPGTSGGSGSSSWLKRERGGNSVVPTALAAQGGEEMLHQKLWNTFEVDRLFGFGGIFSNLSQVKIKFKIDQIFNRELSEMIGYLREMESLVNIELISPPIDFVSEFFIDRKITDCYCLDEENINCVDERLENPEGEEFLINLEHLTLQDVEIDTMTKIFNYNIFIKFEKLREVFFNDIYSIKTNTASILSGSTPQSRSMSFDESTSVVGGPFGGIDQMSVTSPSMLSPSPPAQLILEDPFQFPPPVAQDLVHAKIEKIDLYMIPFNEAANFIKINFLHNFPNLRVLRIRCLSSAKHAGMLGSVLNYKFRKLPSLEEIEIGFLTTEFIRFIVDTCEPSSLRKLSVTSRLDFSGNSVSDELHDFGAKFTQLSDLNIRIHKNIQLEELCILFDETPLRSSLKRIKISWNLVNAIELDTLVKLRLILRGSNGVKFIVSSCSVVVINCTVESASYSNAFERYYYEFCEQRVYCECDECLDERVEESGIENEEHLRRIAMQEWRNELSEESRNILHSL